MTTRKWQVFLEYDPEEDVWLTEVPELNGLATYGATRQEAIDNTVEAITGYLEAARLEGIEIPDEPKGELIQLEVGAA